MLDDKPIAPGALSALDQVATNYIEDSKATRAAIQTLPHGTRSDVANKSKKWRLRQSRRKKKNQTNLSELKGEQEALEKSGPGNLPHGQPRRRRSRADREIAALHRERRAQRSLPHHGDSPNQIFTSAAPTDIPRANGGGYPAASRPQAYKPLPSVPANSAMTQPNARIQPAPQLQPDPVPSSPSSPSLVAICHDCNVRITDFSDSPYDLPTSCPTCQRLLIYRPCKADSRHTAKTTSRFRHLPLDQRFDRISA